jgi:hypothetical protein
MNTYFGLFYLTIFIVISSCGKVPTTEPNQPISSFLGDFENGNVSGFHYLLVDTTQNTQIVTYPVRKGKHALKNTLNSNDYINNGYRTELAIYDCAFYKSDGYYAFSFYIDSNYADYAYNLICQWQDLPYYIQGETWESSPSLHGSPPPIALIYVNETLELKMNDSPSTNTKTFLVGEPLKIQKGQWYDVLAHIYWNDDNTAYQEIWINGKPITPFNGVDNKYYFRNLFNRTGNYFKFGQYRGKDKTEHTNIIYFDEVKIGSTYKEVAP